jgi:hypothetical protein
VLVAALEGDPGELRHAVDELRDRRAEGLLDLLEARAGVLDSVVEERRAEGLRVQPQAGTDLRDLHRVGDEVLAGAPPLIGVVVAREREGALDRVAIDRADPVLRVLGDDREEVAQQVALGGRQLLGDLVYRRGGVLGTLPHARVPAMGLCAVSAYSGCLRLFRYRRPSSHRAR